MVIDDLALGIRPLPVAVLDVRCCLPGSWSDVHPYDEYPIEFWLSQTCLSLGYLGVGRSLLRRRYRLSFTCNGTFFDRGHVQCLVSPIRKTGLIGPPHYMGLYKSLRRGIATLRYGRTHGSNNRLCPTGDHLLNLSVILDDQRIPLSLNQR